MNGAGFLWACAFLTSVLLLIATMGGLVIVPVALALSNGTPALLLLIVLGIPATVGAAFVAWSACGRMMDELG